MKFMTGCLRPLAACTTIHVFRILAACLAVLGLRGVIVSALPTIWSHLSFSTSEN